MRVKSRKPPAENFITSLSVTALEVGGGADDVVGDEVRDVAGDGEDEVVVLGRHHLDVGAEAPPEIAAAAPRLARSAPSGGVRMHQRLSNSSAKPASGPEYSVPATGCAGTK